MMAKKYAPALIDFIRKSPTAFHAAENICKTLTGFEPPDFDGFQRMVK